MAAIMQNALQQEIMVADAVKSYGSYPGLIPISQQTALNYQFSNNSANHHENGYPDNMNSILQNQNNHPDDMSKGECLSLSQRKQREFIPEAKKDDCYWDRRRRNNEAAKRSREKRRFNDLILEQKVLELSKENHVLRAQVNAFESKFQLKASDIINEDQVLSSLPQNEQVLSLARRNSNLNILSKITAQNGISPVRSSSISAMPEDHFGPITLPHMPHTYSPSMYQNQQMDSTSHTDRDSHSPQRSRSPEYIYQNDSDMYPNNSTQSYQNPQTGEQLCPESTVLNLSARARDHQAQIEHMDYVNDRRSLECNLASNIPHKLRHKRSPSGTTLGILTSHLSKIGRSSPPTIENNSRSTTSYDNQNMFPREIRIKKESQLTKDEDLARDSAYDSGISVTSSPPLDGHIRDSPTHMDCSVDGSSNNHSSHKNYNNDIKYNHGGLLRSEIEKHIAKTVENPNDGLYAFREEFDRPRCLPRTERRAEVEKDEGLAHMSSDNRESVEAHIARLAGELNYLKSRVNRSNPMEYQSLRR